MQYKGIDNFMQLTYYTYQHNATAVTKENAMTPTIAHNANVN